MIHQLEYKTCINFVNIQPAGPAAEIILIVEYIHGLFRQVNGFHQQCPSGRMASEELHLNGRGNAPT